jgi:hypothetical protein
MEDAEYEQCRVDRFWGYEYERAQEVRKTHDSNTTSMRHLYDIYDIYTTPSRPLCPLVSLARTHIPLPSHCLLTN